MISIPNARVNTAGAYVCVQGYYAFAVGIRPHDGCIPVVRLGGHREGPESGWQCAIREVFEETSLHITPLLPRGTYLADGDHIDGELREIPWQPIMEHEPSPILVVAYRREEEISLSLMYLALAEVLPTPSSEVQGILLLTKADIHRLCRESITLDQYLREGGKAILKAKSDRERVLEPFAQLRLLSRILSVQSELEAV